MVESSYAFLERGVIAVEGVDARGFLQGLISNDVEKVTPERAIYAALLTPQGKLLFDFFIAEQDGRLLLDVEAARLPALLQRLAMYKLRAKVDVADVSAEFRVAALLGPSVFDNVKLYDDPGLARALDGGVAFIDPRCVDMKIRAMLPASSAEATLAGLGLKAGPDDDYERIRRAFGVPEGAAEFGVDKSPLLECGLDELNGVDFKKGCFVGQELTARMKYRGLVRKRLLPVVLEGGAPEPGAVVKAGERDVGELRTADNGFGFAVLRLDKLEQSRERDETLTADGAEVTPMPPAWMKL